MTDTLKVGEAVERILQDIGSDSGKSRLVKEIISETRFFESEAGIGLHILNLIYGLSFKLDSPNLDLQLHRITKPLGFDIVFKKTYPYHFLEGIGQKALEEYL